MNRVVGPIEDTKRRTISGGIYIGIVVGYWHADYRDVLKWYTTDEIIVMGIDTPIGYQQISCKYPMIPAHWQNQSIASIDMSFID